MDKIFAQPEGSKGSSVFRHSSRLEPPPDDIPFLPVLILTPFSL